jgi:hypothetical protein
MDAMALSAQELELMDLQSELLRDAMDAGRAGADLNTLLTPILLQEAGFNVTRADADVLNPEYEKINSRVSELGARLQKNDKYFNFNDGGEVTLSKAGRFVDGKEGGRLKAMADEYNSARSQLNTTDQYTQRAGDITGLEQIITPGQTLREENETLLLERQNQALRGELPVAPALLSDLEDQEAELRDALLRNLGEGYETSTPGIEALSEFSERRNAILEATRRDDIATSGGLANEMGGFLAGMTGNRFNQTGAVLNSGFGGATNLSNLAAGFSGPLSFLQNNRALDFQIAQANDSPGLLESLLAQGAGTASTFGLAKLFDV